MLSAAFFGVVLPWQLRRGEDGTENPRVSPTQPGCRNVTDFAPGFFVSAFRMSHHCAKRVQQCLDPDGNTGATKRNVLICKESALALSLLSVK